MTKTFSLLSSPSYSSCFSSFVLVASFLFAILVKADDLANFTYLDSHDTGKLTVTLKISEFFYENHRLNVSFWTRAYNPKSRRGSILAPGPLIFIKKGDILTINLENGLGMEAGSQTILNSFHHVNHTNLHTHGLHVNSNKPEDDVFIDVGPNESYQYVYKIHHNHTGNFPITISYLTFTITIINFILCTTNCHDDLLGGTYWYHPHRHGSTTAQVGGGMMGVIIVADAPGEIPSVYHGMPEVVLMIHELALARLTSDWLSTSGDNLFTSPDNTIPKGFSRLLVNGQYQPTVRINQEEWTRFRIVSTSINCLLELKITDDSADCQWHLLAKDGVYVDNAPRPLHGRVYLAPGNRADVVIRCKESGSFILSNLYNQTNDHSTELSSIDNSNILNVKVVPAASRSSVYPVSLPLTPFNTQDSSQRNVKDLPRFIPFRPSYLADLLSYDSPTVYRVSLLNTKDYANKTTCVMAVGANETKIPWDTVTPLGIIHTGTVNKFIMDGLHKHPFHLHSTSFQLGDVIDPTGYYKSGDWQDVVKLPHDPYVSLDAIYFSADSIGFKSVLHCHFLSHEDTGCMGYFRAVGNPNTTTGLKGRSLRCTGKTTGSSTYDASLCIFDSIENGADYVGNSHDASIYQIMILIIVAMFICFGALERLRAMNTCTDRLSKETEMETLGLTSIEMDYSGRGVPEHFSFLNT